MGKPTRVLTQPEAEAVERVSSIGRSLLGLCGYRGCDHLSYMHSHCDTLSQGTIY